MKKLITLLILFVGMVTTAMADDAVLEFHYNYNDDWSGANSYPTFTNKGANPDNTNETIYEYELTAPDHDIYFRLHIQGWAADIGPNANYTLEFADNAIMNDYNQWHGEASWSNDKYYKIPQATIKAAKYKIKAYVQTEHHYYFQVSIVSMPVTIGSTGVATFSCDRALDFTGTGITANVITDANKSTGLLTKVAKTQVPANTGLFLEGSEGTVEVPALASADAIEGNMLVAGPGTTVYQTDGDYTNFILTTNNDASAEPKFFKVNSEGNEVAKGKAYLQIPTSELNARSFFWFEDETTAIEAVKQEIKANGEFFNLAGQRVAQPTKGLYIVNGKKVIMK